MLQWLAIAFNSSSSDPAGIFRVGLHFVSVAVLASAQAQLAPLAYPTRRRIYEHLLSLPGDHFRSIVRSVGLGIGTVSHHLDVLLEAGIVEARYMNGRRRYFPSGQGADADRNMLYNRHWSSRDVRIRVWFTVRRLGPARLAAVAQALGISRQLAAYHLARLEQMGHVRRVGRRYEATNKEPPVSTMLDASRADRLGLLR